MSTLLHIRLLGGFGLSFGSTPLSTVRGMRLQSLLAYFVLHPDVAHHRQHLAFMLWPDSSENQARTNLRKLLLQLRTGLPNADQFLEIDHQTIRWNSNAPYLLDVDLLCERIRAAEQDPPTRESLARLVDMYSGVLLPGCYDEWILLARQQIHDSTVRILYRLIAMLESQQAYDEAICYTQRLLHFDPLQESVYQRLMRLHLMKGDRANAMRVYHECVALLRKELGVEPNNGTRRLYESILRSTSSSPRSAYYGNAESHCVEVCAVEMVCLSSATTEPRAATRHWLPPIVAQAEAMQKQPELAWVVLVDGRPQRILIGDAPDELHWMLDTERQHALPQVR